MCGNISDPGIGPIFTGWRWLYETQVGVSTPCAPVSSKCMEGFRMRRWGLVFPGCGGTSAFPRGETPAARPASPDWPRVGVGRWDRGSENTGLEVICLLHYYIYTNVQYTPYNASALTRIAYDEAIPRPLDNGRVGE